MDPVENKMRQDSCFGKSITKHDLMRLNERRLDMVEKSEKKVSYKEAKRIAEGNAAINAALIAPMNPKRIPKGQEKDIELMQKVIYDNVYEKSMKEQGYDVSKKTRKKKV